jgi:hypothetical protein
MQFNLKHNKIVEISLKILGKNKKMIKKSTKKGKINTIINKPNVLWFV